MNAQQVYTTVTQWLHVQTLMDHLHVNVKLVTLEMDKLVQVRLKRYRIYVLGEAKRSLSDHSKNTVRCQPDLNNSLTCNNCNIRQVG